MGNLLRLISRVDTPDSTISYSTSSCFCSNSKYDIFVDFEHSRPTADETPLYNEADELLGRSKEMLKWLQNYKGASKEIRAAMRAPNSADSCNLAWATVSDGVRMLQKFYSFSLELNELVPKILVVLSGRQEPSEAMTKSIMEQNKFNLVEHLDYHQALVKQLALILDFILKFDELKMKTPSVQNDFSYYRRTLQSKSSSALANENAQNEHESIPLDLANAMSLFFAHATPMLNSLSDAITHYLKEGKGILDKNTTEVLSIMAKVCQKIIDTPELKSRLQYEETELFILRVMVATIILYDHVHPHGAFLKGSPIDVKGCVKVLKDQNILYSESLLNALRYTTKHLNEDTTPKNVKLLLLQEMA